MRWTRRKVDRQLLLHVFFLLIVSIWFESLFIHHGINIMDEGWPLHAAMELHDGKTLFSEVFWVFPPGHLLPAWISFALDPPGFVGARTIYAAFCVALTVALYFVARRLMPADFALLAALLVTISAPKSHGEHSLFGYRYLVWSAIVLLFFQLRLTRDESRWLFPAGLFGGIALFFRLTPALAVSAAVAVGIVAASRNWRRWLRDGLWYAAGLLFVWIPILAWFHHTIGLEKMWIEMVVRPVEMTGLQSKPLPPIFFYYPNRTQVYITFSAVGFRLFPLFYAGFLIALSHRWARAVRTRRPFEDVFLLTFVLFGGIYFVRSMGRSDFPHLDSAIPPVAVLLAYCASLSTRIPRFRAENGRPMPARWRWGLCACVLGVWSFLYGSDQFIQPERMMGRTPLMAAGGNIEVRSGSDLRQLDVLIPLIQEHSDVDDNILVMSHAPLVYVLADRHSPGYHDIFMPGTFRSADEQRNFLELLRANPPAVVVWPRQHFDFMKSRGIEETAHDVGQWAIDNYREVGSTQHYWVVVPKTSDRDHEIGGKQDD